MARNRKTFILLFLFLGIIIFVFKGYSDKTKWENFRPLFITPIHGDTVNSKDTINLPFDFKDSDGLHYRENVSSPLFMNPPSNYSTEVKYDPETQEYIIVEKVGDMEVRRPTSLSFKEYQKRQLKSALQDYWLERNQSKSIRNQEKDLRAQLKIGGQAFERIFGSNTIDIRPQGTAKIDFGVVSNKRSDPSLDIRRQRTTNFKFDEQIAMNVMAKIGDKIQFNINYNTEASFEFEKQKLKLKYEGKEDEILKLIEAGNVNLPLTGSLINGSQSLFGIKTKLKFGNTVVTAVLSKQEGESKSISVEGGAQTTRFQIKINEYEEDKHFFLSHTFRENYNEALSELPLIKSSIEIVKIELWKTTIGPARENNRNIIAFSDLGETERFNNPNIQAVSGNVYPTNEANTLLMRVDTAFLRDINNVSDYLETNPLNLLSARDYEKVQNATKLDPSQYTYNSRLGFISLNTTLRSDQVLAVAYQYKVIGDDRVYQVGEFSDEGINSPQTLVVKLLKSTAVDTHIPMWDLMMKNIYSINAYQLSREDFMLNILYAGGESGVPTGYLNEGPEDVNGVPLIKVLNLDNLNQQGNPPSDGVFDYIDNAATRGGTIESSNGRIYFTVLEPFGSYLREKLQSQELGDKYAYDSLYTMTKVGALQYPSKNKFILEGMYKSSGGSEISLNALNVPRGSVKVTAGGQQLTENVDYTVDYTLGRVRIINEGVLNSGTPIRISLESNTQLNLQEKRMVGAHINHRLRDNFNIGATIINLHERPLTDKVNYGSDPISNTIWGMNLDYSTNSRLLTKLVNKIPFIETKQESMVQFNGEFAHFIPGHAKVVGNDGTAYIADFEGAKSTIDLKQVGNWSIASTPQGQTEANMFPEAATGTGLKYGFNRSKLSWYIIAPLFYDRNGRLRPPNIDNNELSSHYTRQVLENEVFPNVEPPGNRYMNIPIFDVAFYPEEKGPYNYDTEPVPGYSAGINEKGDLNDPKSRWAGIMRKIESTNFEETNIEYLEFWMMDPFADPDGDEGPKTPINTKGGKLYFNLGDISEDILRDRRKSFENGMPISEEVVNVDTTIWGRVPSIQPIVNEFNSELSSRPYQDVGYDGLRNVDENEFFAAYIQSIANLFGTNSLAYQKAIEDPSTDDYHHYRGSDYDNDDKYSSLLERYKLYNGQEGNSPTDEMNPESFPTIATRNPNVEDINQDNTLSESERYYQYMIDLHPNKMEVGKNYIADIYETPPISLPNGQKESIKWYQFKIPVRNPDKVIGNIQDFRSIRFMRMFMKDFEEPIVLRFATLELVRGEWRRYNNALVEDGEYIVTEDNSTLDISAVSIEENGKRVPIPYVLPPGIQRERYVGATTVTQQNEQAMVMEVCDLADGFARAAYKTTEFDFRQYETLKMFIHAEKSNLTDNYNTGDLTLFIRLGSDFNDNYYEYEVPLEFTPWGSSNPRDIWPEANEIELSLKKLTDVKLKRQELQNQGNDNILINMPFTVNSGKNRITLKGVPNLSDVKTIMIGVRNPKKKSFDDPDDGLEKCAEIWVNELRLTGFNEKSGWAAMARMRANLADFGMVTLSGSHSTPGFGSLEQTVNERQKAHITQMDVAANLELGKFFGKESGIKIPMHFDYSRTNVRPEYDPMNPDVKLNDMLGEFSGAERDSIKRRSDDLTVRKNINFMNVRKDRVMSSSASSTPGTDNRSNRPHIWDIENFNLSYAYSEIYRRNIDIEYDITKQYQGGLGYNFSLSPKSVTPFKSISFLRGKWLKLIREFNFNYMPRNLSFRTDMNRVYKERLLRSKSVGDVKLIPTYLKDWDWNRNYNLQYDLTRSLKFNYRANVNAYIHEPPGIIDKNSDNYEAMKDSIKTELFNFGTPERYEQDFVVTYDVPIKYIPILDWVNLQAAYTARYSWLASSRSIQERMGNTIENSNSIQLNSNLQLTTLYNKIGYIKRLNKGGKKRGRRGTVAPRKGPDDGDKDKKKGKDSEQVSDSTKNQTALKVFKFVFDKWNEIAGIYAKT